jgi:hypothetical protein
MNISDLLDDGSDDSCYSEEDSEQEKEIKTQNFKKSQPKILTSRAANFKPKEDSRLGIS